MPSIADLFVTVTSDVSGAISGLTSVDQKVNGTSAAMSAAAPAGFALAAAAGAVGAGFLSSISVASDFEHQINGIKAVMSPTEVNEFGDAVRALALTLGKDTVFTSAQAADAIQELIKAGVPLPAILSGAARSALDLASATGADVTTAAGLASAAMNTFHLSAAALPGVMDTIANVSNATATSVDGLRLGLSDVGSVANQFGLTFGDTALSLGVFANNGLTANTAGSALKAMLVGLIPDTKAQKDAFLALGLTTAEGGNAFFDATGKIKPMADVAEILKTALTGLTAQQQAATLQTLFGTQGMQAAAIAAGLGAAGFDEVSAAANKMGGTFVAAQQRNQGLEGSMKQLGGSFEAIQIQIGTLFLPVLTRLADGLTVLLNAFLTLDPNVQIAIVAIVGITGVVAALLAGFILLEPVLLAVDAAFGIIAVAAAGVAIPIAALAAVGALLYQAWQTNFGGIRDVTDQVVIALQPALTNIQDFIALLTSNLGPALAGVQTSLAPFITALSNDLAPVLARLPDLIRLIGDGFNLLSGPAQAILSIIQILATGNYNGGIFGLDQNSGVVQFFVGLHDAIALFFDAVLRLLNGDFAGAWDALWGSFTTVLQTAFDAEVNLLGGLRDLIVSFLQALPGWIAQNVPGMWNSLLDELGALPGYLQPYWDNFAGWLGSVVGGIPQFVADAAGDVWGGLRAVFDDLVPQLAPAWDAFAGWLQAVVGGIGQFVADNMGDIWGGLTAAFFGLVDNLAPAWDAFAGWLGSVLAGLPQFIADHIGDVWGALVAAFTGSTPGGATSGGTGGTPAPTPIGSGGGGGFAGPLVTIGTVNVGSVAEQDAFLQAMSDAILAAAQRLTTPPPASSPFLP